jgi:hypothetical protein
MTRIEQAPQWLCALLGALALVCSAGCNREGGAAADDIRQTRFPGQITAGGGTSGEVLARHSPRPGSGEATRGQAPGQGVAGTPSIPGGAEGNVGGAAMGGSTSQQAGTKNVPSQGETRQGETKQGEGK